MNNPTPQSHQVSVVLDYIPESEFLAIASSFDLIAERNGATTVHKESSAHGANIGRLTANFADETSANDGRDQIQRILRMSARIVVTDAAHPLLAQ